jgi:ssDNA-binding replication factor A large subunit
VKIAEVKEGQEHIDVTGEVVESTESYERFMGLDFGTFEPVTYTLRDVVIKDETGSISVRLVGDEWCDMGGVGNVLTIRNCYATIRENDDLCLIAREGASVEEVTE